MRVCSAVRTVSGGGLSFEIAAVDRCRPRTPPRTPAAPRRTSTRPARGPRRSRTRRRRSRTARCRRRPRRTAARSARPAWRRSRGCRAGWSGPAPTRRGGLEVARVLDLGDDPRSVGAGVGQRQQGLDDLGVGVVGVGREQDHRAGRVVAAEPQVVEVHRRAGAADHPGAAALGHLDLELLLHVDLVAVGEDHDDRVLAALVGQRQLGDDREDRLRPAQDHGVVLLEHDRAAAAQVGELGVDAGGEHADQGADDEQAAQGERQHREQERASCRSRRRWCRGRGRAAGCRRARRTKPRSVPSLLSPMIARITEKTMISSKVATISQADQRRRARRHRVVEHVAEPVAQPRLLLRRGLDGRAAAVCAIAFAVRTRSCCPVRAMSFLSVPDRKGPRFGPDDPPSLTTGRHWHDRAMQSTPEAADRLARRAAALAFATQGMVFISLTTRLPRFSDRWDLSEVELSLAAADDRPARRRRLGGRRAGGAPQPTAPAPCAPGCSSSRVAVPVVAAAPTGAGLRRRRSRCTAWGWASSTPASNMQAVAVEHRYGRPILPSFHGAWTFGGIIGAVLALAAAHAAALDGRPGRRGAARWPSPRRTCRREHGEALAAAAQVAVPWRPIVLVGLGMVLFYMVDTAAQTWGPTYLDDVVRRPAVAGRAGDAPLPRRQPGRAAGRRPAWWRGTAPCWCCAPASVVGLAGAARGGHRADLAGRGPRLHPARRRRLGDRAAELLRRGPDRRRRTRAARWTR